MAARVNNAPTLERIQLNARSYPGYLLPRGGTALALFSAGFHGWNDCVHFLRHDMQTSCVDTDAEKLAHMASIYPVDWFFHTRDAWEFAVEAAKNGREWDVVCVDTYLGDATERSMTTVGLWTLLARDLVTMTIPRHAEVPVPDGWRGWEFPRSPRASWLVMQPLDLL